MSAISDCEIVFSGHECATAFMSRNWHPIELQRFEVPRILVSPSDRKPAFTLPQNCCDLCDQLGNLAIRAIGPDLRCESTQALFIPYPKCLVLKIHLPNEDPKSNDYFLDRCFYIYSHPGFSCPWYLLKPYPYKNLEWAFQTLQECAAQHDCYNNGKGATPLPTRVIRVGLRPDDIRLESGDSHARYICLSHCWGSRQPLTTTKENIHDHFGRITWESIPLLYQDTIRLAWRLGIEYIWIDSLCIIQDDPDDWAQEAGRMQHVYGNSWLTVAATSNQDCCSGILDSPQSEETGLRFASFHDCIEWSEVTRQDQAFSWLAVPSNINGCEDDKHENGNCRWPLLTRGWVLEERLLSPRVLYFTAAGLLWSCKVSMKYEVDVVGYCEQPAHMGVSAMGGTVGETCGSVPWLNGDFWLDIIEEYSKLKLTDQGDRLPALSGLAQKAFGQMPAGTKYLAGLWSCWLLQCLLWYNVQGNHGKRRNASRGVLTECSRKLGQVQKGTPSWSWAAINASVRFRNLDDEKETVFHVRIGKADCTPVSDLDPTGRVSSGRLHLRGPISPIIKSDHKIISYARVHFNCPVHMNFNYLIDNDIKCLLLYTTIPDSLDPDKTFRRPVGLLLQPVTGKDSEYRRVGLIAGRYLPRASYDPSVYWFKRLSNVEDVVVV